MKSLLYVIALAVGISTAASQESKIIKGSVVSSADSSPIPYANVSITGSSSGTCADDKGVFDLKLSGESESNVLLVSAIGFRSQMIELSKDMDDIVIRMAEKVYELPEFELESMKLKEVVEGKKSKNRAWGFMRGEDGGAQFGRMFNPHGKNVIIDKVHVRIANSPNYEGDYSKLRLRIYSMEKREEEADLLHENIFVSASDTAKWKTIDLSHLDILTNEKFMIGFEWLFDEFTCPIMVAVGGKGTKSFFRLSSHGVWRPTFDMNWAIKATLLVEE